MKTEFLRSILFCGCALILSACSESVGKPTSSSAVIRIDGSSGVMPLVAELIAPFEAANPKLKIEIGKGWSSKTRLQALAENKMDIAMASHGLKADVLAELKETPHLFAKMAVVFAVHESVPIRDLTAEQIARIYSGAMNNWNEVGGPDLKIVRLMRPEDEVDTEVVRAHLPEMADVEWAKDTAFLDSSGDLARALDATKGAIGITTLVRVKKGEHTEVLKLGGIAPTEEAVLSGKYPLSRESFLVTPNQPSDSVQRFLDFLGTEAGQAAIRKSHAFPVSADN